MKRHRNGMPLRRRQAALILPLLVGLAPVVLAEEPAAEVATPAEFVPSYSATLRQLGSLYPMNLHGTEGSDGVSFDVRADQVVTGARLNLEYSYSPALLPDLSQINVMVNDQVAASLALPQESAGSPQHQVVEIPPQLITEFNRLTLQLIGHYTMQCEDPMHSSLWAKVGNDSQLELQTTPIALPDDLGLLPLPFFDPRDARQLDLPFIFAASPDHATLEAAGAVASWFGALASYRGAHYPVAIGDLPAQGNAVLFLAGAEAIPGVVTAPAEGPGITLTANPNDPFGKLLVITGADSEALRQAVIALVSGSQALSGGQAVVGGIQSLQPRKPYDAPNWLPTDRPVALRELIDPKRLSVAGYNPGTIAIPMRLPPDLFDWREPGVALRLKYRYTPQPISTNSSLLISVSNKFVRSLPLPSQEKLDDSLLDRLKQGDDLLREATLRLPLASVPIESALQLRFMYDYIKQGECRDIIIDNMRGTIEPDSSIDLSDYDHFIAMPNLGVFQSSGFPFTRMADLSETAVVLPADASNAEISAYLDVLGGFGDSTGLPATGVTVTHGEDEATLRGKDLLVVSVAGDAPLLERWAEHLPADLDGTPRFAMSDMVHRVRGWISGEQPESVRSPRRQLELTQGAVSAYVAGFESPLDAGRSVVVLTADNAERLGDVTRALRGGEEYEESLQGSLAVVNGKRVSSLLGEPQYHVGELGVIRYLQWQMSRHLFLYLLLTMAGVCLASGLLYLGLRARARARLRG